MRSYNVHEALHQNYEFMAQWVWGSGPRMGLTWPIIKIDKIFENIPLYSHICLYKTKSMVIMSMNPST